VLSEHALPQEQKHQQPHRERRLHDHQGGQQQGEDLQRKPQHRGRGAREPARALEQAPGERQAQVLFVRRLSGIERLERDP